MWRHCDATLVTTNVPKCHNHDGDQNVMFSSSHYDSQVTVTLWLLCKILVTDFWVTRHKATPKRRHFSEVWKYFLPSSWYIIFTVNNTQNKFRTFSRFLLISKSTIPLIETQEKSFNVKTKLSSRHFRLASLLNTV